MSIYYWNPGWNFVVIALLVLLCAIKSLSMLQAIFWYLSKGSRFAKEFQLLSRRSDAISVPSADILGRDRETHIYYRNVEKALIRAGANHFLGGVKQFRARRQRDFLRIILRRKHGFSKIFIRIKMHLITTLYTKLFAYPYLVIIVCIAAFGATLIWQASLMSKEPVQHQDLSACALVTFCFLLAIMNLVSTITLVVGQLVERSFALQFYGTELGRPRANEAINLIEDLVLLGFSFFLILISNAVSVYILTYTSGAFNINISSLLCLFEQAAFDLIKSMYFALTTMTTTGYGDVLPQNTIGFVMSGLIQIQALILLVFAVSSFWATRAQCHIRDD